jgi:acyl-CoA synthetase (AMP-forming)/AMP-acid ligase II
VTIRPPHPQNLQTTLPTVRMIVDVSKSVLVLSNQNVIKLLRSKEASNVVDIKSWPVTLDTDDMPKKKLAALYRAPTAEMLAYLDFSVSTTGMLAGIKMSHAAVTSLCRSMKLACELYPSRHIALCLDPYCGLGFALWCLSSIYSGHHSILIPPSEVELNPALWLSAVSQYRVRDTFCSYGVMELCTKGLGSSVSWNFYLLMTILQLENWGHIKFLFCDLMGGIFFINIVQIFSIWIHYKKSNLFIFSAH